ncbi:MAG: hypothetical protein IT442_01815 [Phycisphaeraceae bacterium]|nr:hypothetical protein [Phycisphaeraceae bacterium]
MTPDGTSPPMTATRARRWAPTAIEALFFLALSLVVTWPMVLTCRTAIPMGTEAFATVPVFNLWTLWWNVDRLEHGMAGYWDAPIHHPAPDTFAFSEPQPLLVLLAPLAWLDSPILACNVFLLLSLTLNGLTASWLVRRFIPSRLVGLGAGAMMLTLPYVHWQFGVYQLVPLWGALWAIGALAEFARSPSVRWGLALGAALACAYALCANAGVFLLVLLALTAPILLGNPLVEGRTWLRLLPGTLLCLALTGPILLAQSRVAHEFDLDRPFYLLWELSAEPGDYTVPPWPSWIPIGDLSDSIRRPDWRISVGYLRLPLAACGLALGICDRRLRRWTFFLTAFGLAAFLLSLGMKLNIGPWRPYLTLTKVVPGIGLVRNIHRYALFVHLAAALLAGQGLALFLPQRLASIVGRLARRANASIDPAGPSLPTAPSGRAGLLRAAGVLPILLLTSLVISDVWPAPQRVFTLPSYEQNQGWLRWLTTHTAPTDVLACLPFPADGLPKANLDTTMFMYWQRVHGRRLVNGYSGYATPEYERLRSLLGPAAPLWAVQDGLRMLRNDGARWCLFSRGGWNPRLIESVASLRKVYSDDRAGLDIYQILDEPPPDPADSTPQ